MGCVCSSSIIKDLTDEQVNISFIGLAPAPFLRRSCSASTKWSNLYKLDRIRQNIASLWDPSFDWNCQLRITSTQQQNFLMKIFYGDPEATNYKKLAPHAANTKCLLCDKNSLHGKKRNAKKACRKKNSSRDELDSENQSNERNVLLENWRNLNARSATKFLDF